MPITARADTYEPFHGAFQSGDVELLLQPIYVLADEKTARFFDLDAEEPDQDAAYLYQTAMSLSVGRLARDVARLAHSLARDSKGPITLVSLVRDGLPLGVLLSRALRSFNRKVTHYGVALDSASGLDLVAMRHITAQGHDPESIFFVDGWTGDGGAARRLEESAEALGFSPRLVTLSDPGGHAWLSASSLDWMPPHAVLGAAAAGLVSLSIRDHNQDYEGFRRAVDLFQLHRHDVTQAYLRDAWSQVRRVLPTSGPISARNELTPTRIESAGLALGVAETMRAVLRRQATSVSLRLEDDWDLDCIEEIALGRRIEIRRLPVDAPFRAIAHLGTDRSL